MAKQSAAERGADPQEQANTEVKSQGGNETQIAPNQDDEATARERAVLRGGPGSDEAVQGFSFKYGDQEFKSQAELEAYIGDLHKEVDKKRKVVETTSPPPPPPPVVKQEELPDPMEAALKAFSDDVFTDPGKAAKALLEAHAKVLKHDMTQAYQTDQTMQGFWKGFYEKNKHLVGREKFVEYVMNKNLAELDPMPMSKAGEALANFVAEELKELGVAAPKPAANKRTITESPTLKSGEGEEKKSETQRAPNGETQPMSLTQSIKARQAARRAAATA